MHCEWYTLTFTVLTQYSYREGEYIMKKKRLLGLNIHSRSIDWRGKILSNLSATPFVIGAYTMQSVESAVQGIKFADRARREAIFVMSGMDALKVGREITNSLGDGETRYVYWGDEKIVYNSIGHRMLVATFIHEKIRQNPKVQEALLATKGMFIFHDVGKENPHTSLPEVYYIEILLVARSLLEMLNSLGKDLSTTGV